MMPLDSLHVVTRMMQMAIMKMLKQRAKPRINLRFKLMLIFERRIIGREMMRRSVKMSSAVVA